MHGVDASSAVGGSHVGRLTEIRETERREESEGGDEETLRRLRREESKNRGKKSIYS